MPRFAVIENGLVVNVIMLDNADQADGLDVVESDSANIGDSYDGTAFTAPADEPG